MTTSDTTVWKPFIELLVQEKPFEIFELYVNDTDLAKIALSSHFSLDILCNKEGDPVLA